MKFVGFPNENKSVVSMACVTTDDVSLPSVCSSYLRYFHIAMISMTVGDNIGVSWKITATNFTKHETRDTKASNIY